MYWLLTFLAEADVLNPSIEVEASDISDKSAIEIYVDFEHREIMQKLSFIDGKNGQQNLRQMN